MEISIHNRSLEFALGYSCPVGSFALTVLLAGRRSNDLVRFLQEPGDRCSICRRREGCARGKRTVALNEIFEFSHIPAEVANITSQVIEALSHLGEQAVQALFQPARSSTGYRYVSCHQPQSSGQYEHICFLGDL